MFRFYGLAERFFPTNAQDEREMLQPGRPCAVFRAEVAILQWLHLASLKRSTLGDCHSMWIWSIWILSSSRSWPNALTYAKSGSGGTRAREGC